MSVKDIASQMFPNMVAWRNTQETEENAPLMLRIENICSFGGKVIITEIGLALQFCVSLVEAAVYLPLSVLSLCFYCITDKPWNFFGTLSYNSNITIGWEISSLLIYNLFCTNLPTRDEFFLKPINDSIQRYYDWADRNLNLS